MCSIFIDFLLLLGEVLDVGGGYFFLDLKLPMFIRLINIHLSFYSNCLSSVNEAVSSKICLHVLAAKTFSVD